jgi:hypothetical protein
MLWSNILATFKHAYLPKLPQRLGDFDGSQTAARGSNIALV